MHSMEHVLLNTINAGIVGAIPATAAEQEGRYAQELDYREEQFRQELERARRFKMIYLGCE